MSIQVNCPACGAQVPFKIGTSMVTVCQYCRSVVARGDRKPEDLGKVADLVDTGAILEVGLRGKYGGKPFELTGRAQNKHPGGGVWDEWYAAFSDGTWGWLAEAQGRFYLTFEEQQSNEVPAFEDVEVGQKVEPVDGAPMVVAEKAWAERLSAEGEIPYRLVPNEAFAYADLSGKGKTFGTIDYGESPPAVYLGREVTLDDLRIPPTKRLKEREGKQVAGHQLNCPQCAGPLALNAPDKTERVACPNCGSLLDVNQGELRFLKALEPCPTQPPFPLGAQGELQGIKWTFIGYMVRSVEFDGVRYPWEEFLLYNPREGFRWLVCSDEHWNYVEPLAPGDVSKSGNIATYDDKKFKLYQRAVATVDYVVGEFYWKIEVGETVGAFDYIAPPLMLSREKTKTDAGSEINWSLGTYTQPKEIAKAFNVPSLPRPRGISPNQPFGYSNIYKSWLWLLAATFVLWIVIIGTGSRKEVFSQQFLLKPVPGAPPQEFTPDTKIPIRGGRNLYVTATSNVDNNWVYLQGAIYNPETGLVQQFGLPVEYYHGVDGGESWSEGKRDNYMFLSSLPAGEYELSLRVERGAAVAGDTVVNLKIEQGVPHIALFVIVLVLISLFPMAVAVYHIYFESQRWKDSTEVGGGGDDE